MGRNIRSAKFDPSNIYDPLTAQTETKVCRFCRNPKKKIHFVDKKSRYLFEVCDTCRKINRDKYWKKKEQALRRVNGFDDSYHDFGDRMKSGFSLDVSSQDGTFLTNDSLRMGSIDLSHSPLPISFDQVSVSPSLSSTKNNNSSSTGDTTTTTTTTVTTAAASTSIHSIRHGSSHVVQVIAGGVLIPQARWIDAPKIVGPNYIATLLYHPSMFLKNAEEQMMNDKSKGSETIDSSILGLKQH